MYLQIEFTGPKLQWWDGKDIWTPEFVEAGGLMPFTQSFKYLINPHHDGLNLSCTPNYGGEMRWIDQGGRYPRAKVSRELQIGKKQSRRQLNWISCPFDDLAGYGFPLYFSDLPPTSTMRTLSTTELIPTTEDPSSATRVGRHLGQLSEDLGNMGFSFVCSYCQWGVRDEI